MTTLQQNKDIAARNLGANLANAMIEEFSIERKNNKFDSSTARYAMGEMLIEISNAFNGEHAQFKRFLDWSISIYLCELVERFTIPKFLQCHDYLTKNGHTSEKNHLLTGDSDNQIWVEDTGDFKIIIDRSLCTTDDNNIMIYIYGDNVFYVRSAYPRAVGKKKPSLATYRRVKFQPHHRDFQGSAHILSYEKILDSVRLDNTLYSYAGIEKGIFSLDSLYYVMTTDLTQEPIPLVKKRRELLR